MALRKTPLVPGEYYHVYNRGVDKRKIFHDRYDVDRFFRSMTAFNTIHPVGSLRNADLERKNSGETAVKDEPLVDIIAYCLNPNHFHLLLREKVEGGVSEFMKRLSGGYVWYFNNKHNRSGVLFEGPFKSSHIGSNTYLLHASAYVNLNFRVHSYSEQIVKRIHSSWDEYTEDDFSGSICLKDSVLGQFRNRGEYKTFAEQSLRGSVERKRMIKMLQFEE